jgi:clan AA aspartic protease
MALIHAEIEVINGTDLALARLGKLADVQVRRMKVKALVDSGAYMLAINEDIQAQLGLLQVEERLAELAEGTFSKLPVVGPVEVRFDTRRCNVDAIVLPRNSEPLLGAIPMEDMDLVINPKTQQVMVDPTMPYISKKPIK